MNSWEWPKFIEDISVGCKFVLSNPPGKDAQSFEICKFEARYYLNGNDNHFHVTNDTRRQIVKFLRKQWPEFNI